MCLWQRDTEGRISSPGRHPIKLPSGVSAKPAALLRPSAKTLRAPSGANRNTVPADQLDTYSLPLRA
jgi:hypothetical protein